MARTVTNKTTHLGRAGEFAAMAEILARGWNVAVPEIDVGDDVFVAQDDATRLTRVQVKTSYATETDDGWVTETIKIPYAQLVRADEVPLIYVLVARTGQTWEFVTILREELEDVWRRASSGAARRRGRPFKHPAQPREDVPLRLTFTTTNVLGPGAVSFQPWRNNWQRFELLLVSTSVTPPTTTPDPSADHGLRSPRAGAGHPASDSSGEE